MTVWCTVAVGQKDAEKLESAKKIKMVRDLEAKSYEKQLKEFDMFSLKREG